MKEIRSIIKAYNSIDFTKSKAAMATVVRVEGSSYRRAGARMLVMENGNYLGGISGGCLEGDALRRAQKAIVQNKPSIITYDTTADDGHQIGAGLGCNGVIDVLFTPLNPNDQGNVIQVLSEVSETRQPRVLVSIIGCNESKHPLGKVLLFADDEHFLQSFTVKDIAHAVLSDIKIALASQTSSTKTYGCVAEAIKVFIEVILPVTNLVVYGSNYDIHTLVRIAIELGWDVTVVTNIAESRQRVIFRCHTCSEQQGTGDTND
jgi:xanthine/CO dehydrogenase XdhC/CoxF family maturation factor